MHSRCPRYPCIWIAVVAASARPGERIDPLRLAARDANTTGFIEIGMPELRSIGRPPYPTSAQALLVTVNAQDIVGCHLALGWRIPERILDLMVEFKTIANGQRLSVGGLAGALISFGLPPSGALGRHTTVEQMRRLLDAVAGLLDAMMTSLDWPRALLRGRYLRAVARIEATGIPVDRPVIGRLRDDWPAIRDRVVEIVDREFGVYRGRRFDTEAFATWLDRRGISWPRVPSGRLDLSDDAFRDMARAHPELRPLKELRSTLTGFDPRQLAIGSDGRNRTPLRPFSSRTGRNQPSSNASMLGSVAWVRHLIRPAPGMGLALIDWAQQEFAIAAALSGDAAMQAAYQSGDPYMAFAIAAGAAPREASDATHGDVRERFKACALGVQYGMGATTLARLTGISLQLAESLLHQHRATFRQFWAWSDGVENHALLHGELTSAFGWRVSVDGDANPRFLRNFPMQANGAEMLRLACCLVTEAGVHVCAPIHDALLIEAPLSELDEAIATTRTAMAEASSIVLDGFTLRTDVRQAHAPDRWRDDRGTAIWSAIEELLGHDEAPAHQRDATCSPVNSRTVLLYVSKEDRSDASD